MGTRNEVQHHGKLGDHGPEGCTRFAGLPEGLARDGELSHIARSVALYVWSHHQHFRQSAKAIADALGMHRDTVSKALAELQERGWLVREIHRTIGPSGKVRTASEKWHLQMTNRPFNQDQIRRLSEPGRAYAVGTPEPSDVPTGQAPTCLPDRHPRASAVGTIGDDLSRSSKDDLVTTRNYPPPPDGYAYRFSADGSRIIATEKLPPESAAAL